MTNFYLGHSRTKKLVKLYSLSKELIKTYGITYFLRIAISELASQKLNLIKSDSIPIISLDTPILKPDTPIHYSEIFENKLNYSEKITIIISLDDHQNSTSLEILLSNISKQSFSNFDVSLISFDKLDFNLDKIIKQYKFKITHIEEKSNFTLENILKNIQSNSFLFLRSSSVFYNDDALLFFISAMIKNPNHDLFYSDSVEKDNSGKLTYFLKPDWSSNLILHFDYISSCYLIRRNRLLELEQTKLSSQNFLYDLLLNFISITNNIFHLPLPLYISSVNSINFNLLSNHLKKINVTGKIENGLRPNTFKINYELSSHPKVSIIIPTKNNFKILKRCIDKIEKFSDYKNWEIIIIDNHSTDKDTLSYYDSIPYKVIDYNLPFNFSKMNNHAIQFAQGDFLLFLNDDTAPLHSSWLLELVKICNQKNIGAVGPLLVHSDETIQHCGISFLKTGSGFHPFQRIPINKNVYHNIPFVVRDVSAVTGACLLTKKEIFDKIGGFDDDFDLYYGDSDLCLKIRKHGFDVVYTPFSKLLHEGSVSIKKHSDAFFAVENHQQFIKKWPEFKKYDPFYHPLLDWNYQLPEKYLQIKILKNLWTT